MFMIVEDKYRALPERDNGKVQLASTPQACGVKYE